MKDISIYIYTMVCVFLLSFAVLWKTKPRQVKKRGEINWVALTALSSTIALFVGIVCCLLIKAVPQFNFSY